MESKCGVMNVRQLFIDLVRLETELWDAVDQRLRTEFDLPRASST